jgi:hypothetical protein
MRRRIPAVRCPVCGSQHEAVTGMSDPRAAPSVGDYSVCIYCGTFLRFGPGLVPAELTVEDVAALTDQERIDLQRARRAVLGS